MSKNRIQNVGDAVLPATRETLKLGDLPIGSLQSRAMARRLVEQRRGTAKRVELILCGYDVDNISASEWYLDKEGTLSRTITIPGGADMAESLRKVGGFTEAELAEVAAEHPTAPEFEICILER